jgi:hypothetical protein
MTLETLIADAVERGVLAAMAKIKATPPTAIETTATAATAVEPPPAARKPGRPKKAAATEDGQESVSVVTDTPLPAPAPAPAVAKVDDIEADRARLITLTSKIENGRKLATELIRQHGPKFDALATDIRATILAELDALVPA